MRVAQDTVVSIEYTLKDDQGNILDASEGRGPMEYLQGYQNIIPGLEQGLVDLVAGDTKTVTVPPELGYGEYSDKLLQRVPLDAFGGHAVQPGMRFRADTNHGMRTLTIKAIEGQEAVLDGNHELAGKTLHFDVKVVAVRAAEMTELAHGHPHQTGGCCGGGGCGSGSGESEGGCCSSSEASAGGCCSTEGSSEGGCCSTEGSSEGGCCSTEEPVAAKQGGCGSAGCGCG
jgi:FKBP-type peptidyl-prolyl cis-trans isomerase SlyD